MLGVFDRRVSGSTGCAPADGGRGMLATSGPPDHPPCGGPSHSSLPLLSSESLSSPCASAHSLSGSDFRPTLRGSGSLKACRETGPVRPGRQGNGKTGTCASTAELAEIAHGFSAPKLQQLGTNRSRQIPRFPAPRSLTVPHAGLPAALWSGD